MPLVIEVRDYMKSKGNESVTDKRDFILYIPVTRKHLSLFSWKNVSWTINDTHSNQHISSNNNTS